LATGDEVSIAGGMKATTGADGGGVSLQLGTSFLSRQPGSGTSAAKAGFFISFTAGINACSTPRGPLNPIIRSEVKEERRASPIWHPAGEFEGHAGFRGRARNDFGRERGEVAGDLKLFVVCAALQDSALPGTPCATPRKFSPLGVDSL